MRWFLQLVLGVVVLPVSPLGDIEVLTDSVASKKILFADDLDIAAVGYGFVVALGSLTMPAVARCPL